LGKYPLKVSGMVSEFCKVIYENTIAGMENKSYFETID
jgi:hypothetical protein